MATLMTLALSVIALSSRIVSIQQTLISFSSAFTSCIHTQPYTVFTCSSTVTENMSLLSIICTT